MSGLSDRIRKTRNERGLSQRDLAAAVGISQQAIAKLEQGGATGTVHLIRIAAALRVQPLWLETGEGPRDPDPTTMALSEAEQALIERYRRAIPEKKRLIDDLAAALSAGEADADSN